MILVYCKVAGATIVRVKSKFLITKLKIVPFIYRIERHCTNLIKVDEVVK